MSNAPINPEVRRAVYAALDRKNRDALRRMHAAAQR